MGEATGVRQRSAIVSTPALTRQVIVWTCSTSQLTWRFCALSGRRNGVHDSSLPSV